MTLLIEILVLLLLTRFCGEAAERLGQSASVGEMTAGILVAVAIAFAGPSLPYLETLRDSEVLGYATNLGIFALVLFAGIEMEPKRMAAHSAGAVGVALGGIILPLAAGFSLAWLFLPESGIKLVQALLVGIVISISAVPAAVKVLMDFGVLNQRFGQLIVTAAVFDDIIGLILLTLLTSLFVNGILPGAGELLWLLLKVGLFFTVTILLGVHVYPRISRGIAEMEAAALEFSALVVVATAYALLAEFLGMHWVLGPFMAGLFFEPERVGQRAFDDMTLIVGAITGGVLGPLFFAAIGMQVELSAIVAMPGLLVLLIALGMVTKIVGAGVPARLIGLDRREALAVGIGMSARGGVGLVVLSIAHERGFFADGASSEQLFSSLVLVIVVTTLLTPIFLRRVLLGSKPGSTTS